MPTTNIFKGIGERYHLKPEAVASMLANPIITNHGSASHLFFANFEANAPAFQSSVLLQAKIHNNVFVIKQPHVRKAFEAERAALEVCNRSENPHIIQLLASFGSGGSGYLLLPAATTDLASFWRNDSHGNENLWSLANDQRRMIGELCGLTDALSTLHTKLKTPQGQRIWCIHGDVKASNILLFPNAQNSGRGLLQLADFGSSTLVYSAAEASKAPTQGASGSYAAPESALGQFASLSTDIWGLGCVLLEALVWIVRGRDGLEDFANQRMHQSYPYNMDVESDHFFQLGPSTQMEPSVPPQANAINPAVASCINTLQSDKNCSDTSKEILDIVGQHMILIDATRRINDENLCVLLDRTLHDAEPS